MNLDEIGDRWDRLDALFDEAMQRPQTERAAFCRSACGDNQELAELLMELVTLPDLDDTSVRDSVQQAANELADADLLTDELLGPWQVDDLLARGGMGEVYRASRADGEFEKRVAIKVIHSRLNR